MEARTVEATTVGANVVEVMAAAMMVVTVGALKAAVGAVMRV